MLNVVRRVPLMMLWESDKPIGQFLRGSFQVEPQDVCARNANTINPKRNVNQNQTVPTTNLTKDWVYRLYKRQGEGFVKKELAVFMHVGSTGMPIFHPLGEPDFQSCFGLNDYGFTWIAIGERPGTKEDLGY